MAERSTSAVEVADNSGDEPPTTQMDEATTCGVADGVAKAHSTEDSTTEAEEPGSAKPGSGAGNSAKPKGTERKKPAPSVAAPELHSGHKLARRYRLEECVTRLDGFSSWRAVDEKLRRAVGVHLLPADHPGPAPCWPRPAPRPSSATRASSRSSTPSRRTTSSTSSTSGCPTRRNSPRSSPCGPMEAHDAYQLVSQVSQAMAAAHREGLAHLKLTPEPYCAAPPASTGSAASR